MKNKLIILSGGMDSVTLLHKEKNNIKLAISFYYGQKHNKEIKYAIKNCKELNIKHEVINICEAMFLFKSNLLKSGGGIPEGHYEDHSMKKTVVPFRNGIMLSIAAGIAECQGYNYILIANHVGDHTIYPDCRPTFIYSMDDAIGYGTYNNIKIQAPFMHLTKKEIALIGQELNIDYGNTTWSCYKGNENHCGKCGTCIERKEALKGFDNTIYEKEI